MKNMSTKKAIIITVITLILALAIIGSVFLGIWLYKPQLDEPVRIVAYFTSSSAENEEEFHTYDFSRITHVIYAFAHVDGTTHEVYIENESGLNLLSQYLKSRFPDVKLMLSIATSWSNDGLCYAAHTNESRKNFVAQCKKLMSEYSLDGFDLDWEYPTYNLTGAPMCSDCATDHASLLEEMRKGLPQGTVLSFAGGGISLAKGLKNARLSKVVDFVNVMLYDMGMSSQSPFDGCKSVMYQYQLLGYSKKQLNWGLPFYGRCAEPDFDYFSYEQIMSLIASGEAELVQKEQSSYAIYRGNKISFDTQTQISKKAKYVQKLGYGGMFCWHLKCDRNGELMNTLWDVFRT